MLSREMISEFRRDPVSYLDRTFPAAGDAFWSPGRQLCVAEPAVARSVLINGEGLYEQHADFFQMRRGGFGPREAQIQIGRSARTLLRGYLLANSDRLAESVRRLPRSSEWPDAGNRLVYRHLVDILISPDSPAPLRGMIDAVLERAVLAGARQRYSRLRRAVFRFRVERMLARAVEERRARGVGEEPVDLLDVVVRGGGPDAPAVDLAEVFLSFIFSIGGSVGFVLGWSVWLLGTNPRTEAPPASVVMEALRLWPVAWMLSRQPTRPHEIAGVEVTPQDLVVVCPYLVHRHPRYWDDPASFRPERWAGSPDLQAFIPFGWGPHTCVAGSLSTQLVEDILKTLLDGHELTVAPRETRPCVGPALAPPRFTLGLHPATASKPGERR